MFKSEMILFFEKCYILLEAWLDQNVVFEMFVFFPLFKGITATIIFQNPKGVVCIFSCSFFYAMFHFTTFANIEV